MPVVCALLASARTSWPWCLTLALAHVPRRQLQSSRIACLIREVRVHRTHVIDVIEGVLAAVRARVLVGFVTPEGERITGKRCLCTRSGSQKNQKSSCKDWDGRQAPHVAGQAGRCD